MHKDKNEWSVLQIWEEAYVAFITNYDKWKFIVWYNSLSGIIAFQNNTF